MKTLLLLLVIASLSMAQQPGVKPGLRKDRQVLFDFRADTNITSAKITAATQRSVLSKLFRRYLTDPDKCSSQFDARNATDLLAAARKAGQIVPSIVDTATGSFTAAGQTQTLYVISVSECNASHADNFGTKRVAIFSGQQLVADIDADFKSGIARKTDLNSDGIDELLLMSSDMGQGTLIAMAALVSFQNGKARVIEDFGTVVEDSCASGFPESSSKAAVLYISNIVPGNMPKLTMDNYAASCRNTKRWRFVSSGKMQ
jgi:hypothetical protein